MWKFLFYYISCLTCDLTCMHYEDTKMDTIEVILSLWLKKREGEKRANHSNIPLFATSSKCSDMFTALTRCPLEEFSHFGFLCLLARW